MPWRYSGRHTCMVQDEKRKTVARKPVRIWIGMNRIILR